MVIYSVTTPKHVANYNGWVILVVMRYLLLTILLVAGCKHSSGGSSGGNNNSPPDEEPEPVFYPFEFDVATPEGIQIETNGHTIPQVWDIDTWYAEVSQCVSDGYIALGRNDYEFVPGPPVIIKEDLTTIPMCDVTGFGVYCVNYAIPFMGLDSSNSSVLFRREWKHEFIHHILFSNDVDTNHTWHKNHIPNEIWDCEWN